MSLPLRALFAGFARPLRPPLSVGDRFASFCRMMRIDARRSFGLLLVLATAALAIFVISRFAVTGVVLWRDWSAYVARSVIVVGPAMAAWAAFLAQRDARPNIVNLLHSTANSRIRRELGRAVTGMLAALACYGIVAAALLGYAARHATWGEPDVWMILFGAAASIACALVGWLLGALAPDRVTPVVAALVLLIYPVVTFRRGVEMTDLAALQPSQYVFYPSGPSTRLFSDTPLYAGMPHPGGGALLALGGGVVLVAVYLRVRDALRPSLVALALGALLLVPGWVIATDQQPVAWSPLANPEMTCAGEVVTVCLHQAFAVQLDEAAAFADAFYAPLAGIADIPGTITQQRYRDQPPAGTISFDTYVAGAPVEQLMLPAMTSALFGDDTSTLNASQTAILAGLADCAECRWVIGSRPPDDMSGDSWFGDASEPEWAIAIDEAAERFDVLPPQQQRAWLEANWDDLRAGDLTLEDVP